jgi:hypothetical protein
VLLRSLTRGRCRYTLAALSRASYFEAQPCLVYHGAVYVAAGLRPYPEFWAGGVRPGPAGHFTYALDPNTMQYTLLHPPGRERGVTNAVHFHEEGHVVFDLVNNDDRGGLAARGAQEARGASWLMAQWESFYAQHVADEAGHLHEQLVPYVERNQTYRYDAEEAFADLYSCLVRGRTTNAAATTLIGFFQELAIQRHNRALAQVKKQQVKEQRP